MNNFERNRSPVKVIFAGGVARELLRRGYQIVDVRPNRDYPERSVFIFKDVPGLKDDLREVTSR